MPNVLQPLSPLARCSGRYFCYGYAGGILAVVVIGLVVAAGDVAAVLADSCLSPIIGL